MSTVTPGTNVPAIRVSRLLLAAVTILMLLGLAIMALRLKEMPAYWDLYTFTGPEEEPTYTIWKFLHGLDLYEWTTKDNFVLTYYNWLFYYFYAAAMRLMGGDGERILIYGRLLSLLLGAAGACVHWSLLRTITRVPVFSSGSLLWASLSVYLWLGHATMGTYALTIRPDVGAILLSMIGVAVVVRAIQHDSLSWWLAASLVFWLTWSFKQSAIWIFCGTGLYLLIYDRRWRNLLAFGVPFALGCAAALLIGGEVYRLNLITLPGMAGLKKAELIVQILRVHAVETFVLWGGLLVMLAGSLSRHPDQMQALPPGSDNAGAALDRTDQKLGRYLACVLVVTTFWSVPAMMRSGSSTNTALEWVVMAGTCWCYGLSRLLRSGDRRADRVQWALTVVVAMGAVIALVQLRSPYQAYHWSHRDRIIVANDLQVDIRRQLFEFMRQVPKPLLTTDAILTLPWHSTEDQSEAMVINFFVHEYANQAGMVPEPGLAGLFKSGRVASVLVPKGSQWLIDMALDHDFVAVQIPKPMRNYPCLTWLPVKHQQPRLLIRRSLAEPFELIRLDSQEDR